MVTQGRRAHTHVMQRPSNSRVAGRAAAVEKDFKVVSLTGSSFAEAVCPAAADELSTRLAAGT